MSSSTLAAPKQTLRNQPEDEPIFIYNDGHERNYRPEIELRAFDAAARHLSFKKGAAELGVTPTAISHQIRLLERYCGAPLFRRRPRTAVVDRGRSPPLPRIRDGPRAFAAAIARVKRMADKQPLCVTDHKRLCQPLARAAPPRWRKRRSR